MRISDWSSDVCSSDLDVERLGAEGANAGDHLPCAGGVGSGNAYRTKRARIADDGGQFRSGHARHRRLYEWERNTRSEEHTSELQSLMSISYAVFCLKQKTQHTLSSIHITTVL